MKGLFKQTFSDIFLLYKNFIHWNVSKVIYLLYGIFLGFIFLLPFALIYFIYIQFAGGDFMNYVNSIIHAVLLGDSFLRIIYVFSLLAYGLGYFYSFILIIRLNNSYLNGNKLNYLNNSYFDFRLLLKYIFITLALFFVCILIPLLIFILLFGIVIFLIGGIDTALSMSISNTVNFFILFTFISFILYLFGTFYLLFRFIFSYFYLADDINKKESCMGLLKLSYMNTKGFKKIYGFLQLLFLLLIMYLPFFITFSDTSNKSDDIADYIKYASFSDKQREEIKESDYYYAYEKLELRYGNYSLEQLIIDQKSYSILSIIFSILEFVFINGIFVMLLNSYNKRILTQK